MAQIQVAFGTPITRGTEDGFRRITEELDVRNAETPNAGVSTLTANLQVIPFSAVLSAKVGGTWEAGELWIRRGGVWIKPVSAYKKIAGVWKRIV